MSSTPLTGDRLFRNEVIRIADLTVNTMEVTGFTFMNCRIMGPAVLIPQGRTEISNCSFDGDVAAVFWEIPSRRAYVLGGVATVDCTFSACNFNSIGLAGPSELGQMLERSLSAT
jgi:hypothetical protein